jgi:hypothetical protein
MRRAAFPWVTGRLSGRAQAHQQQIAETNTSGSLAVYHTFATYAAEQLPYIWMPNSAQANAVSKNVHGVVFNPLQTLMPEYWYLTKP